ncbi:uncharacterized protein LY79DRAFT_572202 [Colletotrichum navitas]|uniref:Uncharacterized protein n=1 Tax=Colletotrichum navitas TaxID=681940 RepID=A0AAD8UYT1_9PEZI|nr:uncharacterized protein LY79DRAFT_572202 [Colletotrichum navitas]KAK1566360.1 hypothetical protein LY79DRAFT_572202 [Colletotrichum navitas]
MSAPGLTTTEVDYLLQQIIAHLQSLYMKCEKHSIPFPSYRESFKVIPQAYGKGSADAASEAFCSLTAVSRSAQAI